MQKYNIFLIWQNFFLPKHHRRTTEPSPEEHVGIICGTIEGRGI